MAGITLGAVASGFASQISSLSSALIGRNDSASVLQSTVSVNQIINNFSQYIVTPLNAFGLGGFVFDIEGETTVNLSADITDHWIESNSTIQDHIGIRPEKITLTNYVGELVDRKDTSTNTSIQKVTQKLTVLADYLPDLSEQAQQAYDLLKGSTTLADIQNLSVSQITSEATSLWGLTKNLNPGASRQQQAYLYFKALFQQQMLVSLQTPYEFISNMAIESVVATQGENSRDISEFTITLKQLRFASSQTVAFDPTNYQDRASPQKAPTINGGKTAGTDTGQAPAIAVNANILQQGGYPEPPSNPEAGN